MRILRIFTATLLLSTSISASNVVINPKHSIYSETPDKTIIIKHPAANNMGVYFASTKIIFFEVYKPGSKEDLAKIIATLSKDSRVESCSEGVRTGDYQALSVNLKDQGDKEWFVKLCKKAGLNNIKINNDPVKEIDKL